MPRISNHPDQPWHVGAAAAILLLALLVLPGATRAEEPHVDPLAVAAESYCALFMAGDDDGIRELSSAQMQAALTTEKATQVRTALTTARGTLKSLGKAWMEDEVQGHLRYRVPATFERGKIDLRVVFDGEGKVAGFFQAEHVDPSASASAIPAKADPAVEGHWEGEIETPGQALTAIIDLAFAKGAWSGTFGSPMQGAADLPLSGIQVEDGAIRFSLAGVPGEPTFDGKLVEDEIRGTFTQMGRSFSFRLGREPMARPARPQEPIPPFPYGEEEVSLESGAITLGCTLTVPTGDGPFPAIYLITGSGAQDRNEEIFGHKPFLVIADLLTRDGVAVLRCDDRGVGGSGGNLGDSTTTDLADDALAAVRYLAGRPKIDPARVGLLGHSEGGIVAPLAALRSETVSFVVMLAGTGVPGGELLVRQIEMLLRASGVSEEMIETALVEQAKLIELIAADAEGEQLYASYRRLTEIQITATGAEAEAEALEAMAVRGVGELTTPWFRSFLEYDPRPALRKLKVPVLAINGELDLQVDPKQNLPQIRKALEEGENPDFTVKELAGLNHLFQPAESGSIEEYGQIEQTIDPAALELIREWIAERTAE